MIHYVLDASALLELYVAERPDPWLRRAFRHHRCASAEVLDLDAATRLGRLVELGALSEVDAREVLREVRAAPVLRVRHGPLLERVWALRHAAHSHAAVYLALAELLEVPLLTSDPGLDEVPGHSVRVVLSSGSAPA